MHMRLNIPLITSLNGIIHFECVFEDAFECEYYDLFEWVFESALEDVFGLVFGDGLICDLGNM